MINNEIIETFNHLPDKLIATVHKDPDFDAIGSLLALGNLINKLGKEICLYAPDIDINQFENLPGINSIETKIEKEYELAFFLDCSDKNRIYHPKKFPKYKQSINIDHHQDNTNFGTYNLVLAISSVGEIIYNLYQSLNIKLDTSTATQIYAAICFDTGNFQYSNTTSSTFTIAAELLKHGISNHQISEWIFENKNISYFQDIKLGLHNMYIDNKFPFIIVQIPLNDFENRESTINFFRTLKNIELVIVCKETAPKTFKLSFRSKNKINVANLAKAFNGGGHKRAAGAYFNQITIDEVKTKLITKIYEAFQ